MNTDHTKQAKLHVTGAFYFDQTGTNVTIGREDGSDSNIYFATMSLLDFRENNPPYEMTLNIYGGEF